MSAATTAPRRGGLAGGWLSMAPEPEREQQQQQHNDASTSSATSPPRRAVFQLGQTDDDEENSNDIDTPVTPQSQDEGSSSFMAPSFDVRSSFAPMTFKRPPRPVPAIDVPSTSTILPQNDTPTARTSKPIDIRAKRAAFLHHIEDDGLGIEYGGRRWKGKTAHAVEQEMEMIGDTTVMSYAPDAVYLASRLEGLRRNLEAGGDAARGRRWLGSDSDVTPSESDSSSRPSTPSAGVSPISASRPRTPDDRRPASLPPHITDLIPAAVGPSDSSALEPLDPAAKAAALESRVEIRLLRRSDLEQVRDLHCLHGDYDKTDVEHYVTSAAFLLRLLVDEGHVCLVAVAKPIPAPAEPFPSRDSLPLAHAHHGHAHGHGHGVPRPPPPSMDMPPSSAAYVFAAKGIATDSPFLSPTTRFADGDEPSKRRKRHNDRLRPSAPPPAASSSSLGRHTPVLGSMLEEHEDEEEDDDGDVSTTSAQSSPSSLSARMDDIDMEDSGEGEESGTSASTSLRPSTIAPLSPFEGAAASHRGNVPLLQRSGSSATSPLSLSSTGMAPKREYATTDMILAGPTNEVAPPRALRVMVPPAPGAATEAETILGVASAQVTLKPPTESLWGEADASSSQPHKEIHILTLSVAKAERGLGLGGKLLDQLVEEATRRNVGAAYRAAMGRRRVNDLAATRTYLQVHAESSHAIRLYKSRGFGEKQRLNGYFRGDARIPAAVRSMPGGNDALLMERFEQGR